jgi:hypothetical protein
VLQPVCEHVSSRAKDSPWCSEGLLCVASEWATEPAEATGSRLRPWSADAPEWLAKSESHLRFGKVCVNYADGRIVIYEVYHRERTALARASSRTR